MKLQEHTFSGYSIDNKLFFHRQDLLERFLRQFGDARLDITITNKKPTRSQQQNRLYFLYLRLIEDSIGHSAEELHEIFKRMFLKPRVIIYKGHEIKIPATTITLSKSDFIEYLMVIERETGVPIPDTDDFNEITKDMRTRYAMAGKK